MDRREEEADLFYYRRIRAGDFRSDRDDTKSSSCCRGLKPRRDIKPSSAACRLTFSISG
jgi:hypothetical protein